MGKERPRAVVLDAGALIAFERGDERMRALVRHALRTQRALVVPAGVIGQVFRDGSPQARLCALLAGATTEVAVLDQPLAEAAGRLCGRTGTSDVIDASVVADAHDRDIDLVALDLRDAADGALRHTSLTEHALYDGHDLRAVGKRHGAGVELLEVSNSEVHVSPSPSCSRPDTSGAPASRSPRTRAREAPRRGPCRRARTRRAASSSCCRRCP